MAYDMLRASIFPDFPSRGRDEVMKHKFPVLDQEQLEIMTSGKVGMPPGMREAGNEMLRTSGRVRQKLAEGKRVVLTVGDTVLATFEPEPGAVLAACLRETAGDTRSVLEHALMPYADISVFGVTPADRWRAGEAYRPYAAIQALVAAVDARPVTRAMVMAAGAVLPGVPLELVFAALEQALVAQRHGVYPGE